MFRLKDTGDTFRAKNYLHVVGTPPDLVSLMQAKDPAIKSQEEVTIFLPREKDFYGHMVLNIGSPSVT